MTTPKFCESGACIHVHEEGGIVHIRSTETGDSMTATPAEWSDYLAKVRKDEPNIGSQLAERVAKLEAQRESLFTAWVNTIKTVQVQPGNALCIAVSDRTTEEDLDHLQGVATELRDRIGATQVFVFAGEIDIAEAEVVAAARISDLELANKTLETALKHSADLNETLQAQRDKVLAYLDEVKEMREVIYAGDIRNIYAGKEG